MINCFISFILLFFPVLVTAERVTTLSGLLNPHKIIVDGDEIFIEDFPKIYVYSAKDFKLKRAFGRKGEGPGEFVKRSGYVRLNIKIQKNSIFVESNGRLSFFTRDGQFIRQLNSAAAGYLFQPLGKDKLIALKNVGDSNTLLKTVNIFDSNLDIEKQIFSIKHGTQPGRPIVLFDKALRFYVGSKYIYIVSDFDFLINVFDYKGNHVRKIRKKDYEFLEITEDHKKRTHEYLKKFLSSYPRIKSRLKFPEKFLAIRDIKIDGKLLYVTTFKRKGGTVECFIIDQKGTIQKQIYLPLIEENILREYPFDIHKGKVYQLVESGDSEQWNLFLSEIK